MMILQVMFFGGLAGKLLKLLHLHNYRNLYKLEESVFEKVRALRETLFVHNYYNSCKLFTCVCICPSVTIMWSLQGFKFVYLLLKCFVQEF